MAEGHADLRYNPVEIDAELVGETDPLGAQVEDDRGRPGMGRQHMPEPVDLPRSEAHGGAASLRYRILLSEAVE